MLAYVPGTGSGNFRPRGTRSVEGDVRMVAMLGSAAPESPHATLDECITWAQSGSSNLSDIFMADQTSGAKFRGDCMFNSKAIEVVVANHTHMSELENTNVGQISRFEGLTLYDKLADIGKSAFAGRVRAIEIARHQIDDRKRVEVAGGFGGEDPVCRT